MAAVTKELGARRELMENNSLEIFQKRETIPLQFLICNEMSGVQIHAPSPPLPRAINL